MPRHPEPKLNFVGIFVHEVTFWREAKRYGTFDEVGFALAGNSHRYTYRIDRSGSAGTIIPAKTGPVTPDNTVVPAGISAEPPGFTATATANLDEDPTIDQWHVNDRKGGLDLPAKADVDDVCK